jgi:hypothetical protein
MKLQMIPFSQLVPSPDNVRKTGANEGSNRWPPNIRAIGLLQNLRVRQTGNGKYEVLAGARRHAILKLLVKQKAFDKDSQRLLLTDGPARIGRHFLTSQTLSQPPILIAPLFRDQS